MMFPNGYTTTLDSPLFCLFSESQRYMRYGFPTYFPVIYLIYGLI